MTAPDTTSEAQIQVRFTIERDGLPPYQDALYVPIDKYQEMLASGEIERQQEERYANARAAADAPASAPEPVVVTQAEALAVARQALMDAAAVIDAVTADPVVIDQEP